MDRPCDGEIGGDEPTLKSEAELIRHRKRAEWDNLTNREVLNLFSDKINHKKDDCSEFTFEDLVGKTLENYREIIENKKRFHAFRYDDGCMLLQEIWGDNECAHINSWFYKSKKEIFYNDDLLNFKMV